MLHGFWDLNIPEGGSHKDPVPPYPDPTSNWNLHLPTSMHENILEIELWEETESGQAMGEACMSSWRTAESLSVPSWHSPKSLGTPPGAACSGFYLNLAIPMCQLQSHLPFNQKHIFQLVLPPGWAPNASCGCFPEIKSNLKA